VKNSSLSLALLLFTCGCVTGPRGFPPTAGISNFDRVSDDLYRGGQPNDVGIESLKRAGIKTIVNLRMTNDVRVTEEAETRANGIIYTNVPMRGLGRPTDEQVATVLSIIETFPSPVFIHCEHGRDRTGTIIACYRIKHDQWTSKQALSEASQYGLSKWEIGMINYVVEFGKLYNSR
jgi:protein tyrosine/serine phosphatase